MYPELNIFGIIFDSYRFFFISGWLLVLIFSFIVLSKKGLDKKNLLIILIISSIFSFIGARLFHFFLYYNIYSKNPELLFNLNMQGQAIIGGLFAAYFSIYFLSKYFKFNHWQILDNMAPLIGLGLVMGRIGCLLAGCCFGKETNLPIGITFPPNSPAYNYQLSNNPLLIFNSIHKVFPTQIFEIIVGFIIFFVGIIILKKSNKDGITILSTSIIYLVFRIINNYFRAPALIYSVPDWFYPSFYGILILIIIFMLIKKISISK